jgi:predicted Zn-dependent protease
MISFNANWFDGRTSRAHPVFISFDGQNLTVVADQNGEVLASALLVECRIEPALGSTVRTIQLPDEGCLESRDNQAVVELEKMSRLNRPMRSVYRMESSRMATLGALMVIILFSWLAITQGVPFLSNHLARRLPQSILSQVSDQAFATLDNQYLGSSELKEERLREIETLFASVVAEVKERDFDFRLVFRKGGVLGANAFALPDGLVVVTDELVKLAGDDLELAGVLAHEVAHVTNRHAARGLFQTAGVYLLVSMLLGDVTSIHSVFSSFPLLLLETGYSRDFEIEADRAAGAFLIAHGHGTAPMCRLLNRLDEEFSHMALPAFLSTHPPSGERIVALKALER